MTKEEMTPYQIGRLLAPMQEDFWTVASAAEKVSQQLRGVAMQFREVERRAILELVLTAGTCIPASAQRPSDFVARLAGGVS